MRYETGNGCRISEYAQVGLEHPDLPEPTVIGNRAMVRAGTIIYTGVRIGDDFKTGHNALVREATQIGDEVIVGTNSVIDGHTSMGARVSLQTNVYIPSHTVIGSDVFLGPGAVLTNDPMPVRHEVNLTGPTIEDHVSIGANATVLPEVTVGTGSFIAAGAIVTKEVPPDTLAIGAPARHESLPDELQGDNNLP